MTLKAHILTGCDTTSKIGTKKGALKASLEKYLSKFGNDRTDVLSYENAESFLAKVLNASSHMKHMLVKRHLCTNCHQQVTLYEDI